MAIFAFNQEETITPALYDTDFNLWIEETAKSLKAGNFQELDLENLIEEIDLRSAG